jgi:hypothetical protein
MGGHDVAAFDDSMLAWDALKTATRIMLLITRVRFPSDTPHGVALAQWARSGHPGVRVLFVAQPDMEAHTEGVGLLLPMPVSVAKVAEVAARILAAGEPGTEGALPSGVDLQFGFHFRSKIL